MEGSSGLNTVVAWQEEIITGGTVENRPKKAIEGELRFFDGNGLGEPIKCLAIARIW